MHEKLVPQARPHVPQLLGSIETFAQPPGHDSSPALQALPDELPAPALPPPEHEVASTVTASTRRKALRGERSSMAFHLRCMPSFRGL